MTVSEVINERSSLFPKGKHLLCEPRFYDVTYEINPWMHLNKVPEHEQARKQWRSLHHALIRLGAWVEYVEPLAGQPDMVFTANAGLLRNKRVVLSRFRYAERAGEAPGFRAWFERSGYEVLELDQGYFEGAGDALFEEDTLFGGFGFRSDPSTYAKIAEFLSVSNLIMCELVDPRFYHLDTCFCPLGSGHALIFPQAFSAESLKRMNDAIQLIEVEEDEAVHFACNSVVLGRDIVMPAQCKKTSEKLRNAGFNVFALELGEFIKAGGASKCLTLKLSL